MKKLFLFTILLTSLNCFSQTEYYTADGIHIFNKTKLDSIVSQTEKKLKNVSLGIKIKDTEIRNDSIIHKVTFAAKILSKKEKGFEYFDKKLPSIPLTDIDRNKIVWNKFNGKPTLINFWFTSCSPCVKEIPALNKLYEKYNNEFNFVAITYESEKEVKRFLKKHPYKFKQIINGMNLIKKLKLKDFPTTLILDKNGVIKFIEGGIPYISRGEGDMKMGDGEDFIEKLNSLK